MVKTKVAIKHTLLSHFNRINENPRWKTATKIFIPENNLGNEATHMNSMIKRLSDVKTYWQKDDRPGISKTAAVSDNYQFLLYTKLQHNGIFFDMDCFTMSRKLSIEDLKFQLREQMERYHYEFDAIRNKVHLTGKMGGGKQDDLLIALMMSVYWGRAASRSKGRLN